MRDWAQHIFQRARETGDVSDYQLAEAVADQVDSILFPRIFQLTRPSERWQKFAWASIALRTRSAMRSRLSHSEPGDVSPFAIVGDAYADMGEYDKAGRRLWSIDASRHDAFAACRLCARQPTLLSEVHRRRYDQRRSALMKTAVTEGVEAQLPSENLAWLYYELGEYEAQAGDVRFRRCGLSCRTQRTSW